ncbi:MAG: arginine kinase [Desulfobacter sp.]|nr:MAG: arginine kinase [Desulfobacter sp.]
MKAEPALPLFHPDSRALVKTHLPPELYTALARVKTGTGFTLEQAIQSGVKHPDSSIGIYAGDKESYTCFSKVFDPIIQAYHHPGKTHKPEFSPQKMPCLDPEGLYIKSARVRVARNLDLFPFPCQIRAAQRVQVEKHIVQALEQLPPDLSGRYLSFSDMKPTDLKDLVRKKLAFPRGDRFQEAAGINRDFPLGRGVFLSHDHGFRVWVNEEDHLRVMALCFNADISKVFNRVCRGLESLTPFLGFSHDDQLGFLSSCPTNIGTAMRAGVHICLKKLEQRPNLLKEIVSRHHLQVRGTLGEKTAVDQSIFDISNARRLGISANTILQDLHAGVTAILQTEKNL